MTFFLRRASLALALLFAPAVTLWVYRSEMTHLWWIVPGAVLVSAFLLGLHYLVFGAAPRRLRLRRFSIAVVAFLSVSLVLFRLIRYEGSTSGSSFPKFSWAWEKSGDRCAGEAIAGIPASSTRELPPGAAGDLEDFLGPGRDGAWEEASFGTDWKAHPPELLWRRAIGKGWSSFAVSGNRALTQQQSGDDERVTCLDLATGRDLWNHTDPGVRLLLERAENGGAAMGGDGPRATPTLSAGRVYAMGATGIVNCLDLETGASIWSRHLLKDLGGIAHRWGMANSPLVLPGRGLVVFAGLDDPGASLVACALDSGETRWVFEGKGTSYSSPRLLGIGGVEQIVAVNQEDVCGLDPATGALLWSHPWPGKFPKVGQPLLLEGDRILVTASYGAGSLLLSVKRGGDGKFSTELLWKSTYLKTKFSSAAVLGDHAYGLDEGRLACIDLATGKRVWKNEKFGFGQHLRFGEHLLVQTEPGEVVIGRIGPTGFVETGRIPALSSMTWNTPAVAGRVLLVRNDLEASAWLLPEP